MRSFLFFISLLFLCGPLAAVEQTVYPAAGVASRWLNLPNSARVAGLGGAMVARGAEPAAMDINPASLAGMQDWQVLFTHNAWVQGIGMEDLSAAWHQGCWGTFGASLDFLNLGQVDEIKIDSSGNPVTMGTLYPSSTALALYWAEDWGRWSLGLGLHGLFENVVGGWDTGGVGDLGLRWHAPNGWRAGVSVNNLAFGLSSLPRPLRARFGFGYTSSGSRPLALDFNTDQQYYDQNPFAVRTSAEWAVLQRLALRGSWVFADAQTPHGPSLGFSWLMGILEIDYAYNMAGDLGNSQMLTLRLLPQ